MADPQPGERRKSRAAIVIVALVLAIVVAIFVTFNISHYRAMENEVAAEHNGVAAR